VQVCLIVTGCCFAVQIDLSNNALCGIRFGQGTYTADGIKVIAESIRVSPSLTSINLRLNNLGSEGAKALAPAIRDSPSVTSVTLLGNSFDNATVEMLLKLKEEKPSLISLCGLALDQTEANFKGMHLRPADARLLAPEIIVRPSLTRVNVRNNGWFNMQDKDVIRKAVEGRSGFELLL
jgi:hypothetical protein